MAAKWAQKTVVIPPQSRGCHLVTSKILREIEQDLSRFKCGLAHLFLQHTSASLTINENYDSDVQDDTETFLNKIVPEGIWLCEHRDHAAPRKIIMLHDGTYDDLPSKCKSAIFVTRKGECNITLNMKIACEAPTRRLKILGVTAEHCLIRIGRGVTACII